MTPAAGARRLLAAVVVVVVGLAAPAAADPAGPTRYRSELTGVTPDDDRIEVEVLGGDSFLQVRAEPGTEVEVAGYESEPYARILADGTVEENRRSPSTYLNLDRYQDVDVPAIADATAEPEWEVVGRDGRYAWHDHRIHWMSPAPPPGISAGEQPLPPWEVELLVDGEVVVVAGTLTYLGASSPLPWVGLAVVVAAGVVALGATLLRRRPLLLASSAALVGAVAATAVGWADLAAQPPEAEAAVTTVVVPAVGVVAALVAVLAARRRPSVGAVATLAAVAAAGGWVLLRLGVLTNPVLPSDLPVELEKAAVALAAALAVAAAALTVRSGALALPALPDDPD